MTLDTHAMLLRNAEVPPDERLLQFTIGDKDLERLLIRQRDKTLRAVVAWLGAEVTAVDVKAPSQGAIIHLRTVAEDALEAARRVQEACDG